MFMPVCWAAPTTWFDVVLPPVERKAFSAVLPICSHLGIPEPVLLCPRHAEGLELSILAPLPSSWGWSWSQCTGSSPRSWGRSWFQCTWSSPRSWGGRSWSQCTGSSPRTWGWSWSQYWILSQIMGVVLISVYWVLSQDTGVVLISVYWVLSPGHAGCLELNVLGPLPRSWGWSWSQVYLDGLDLGHVDGLDLRHVDLNVLGPVLRTCGWSWSLCPGSCPRTYRWSWVQCPEFSPQDMRVVLSSAQCIAGSSPRSWLVVHYCICLAGPSQDHGVWCWPGPCAWCVLSPRLVVLIGQWSHLIALVMTWGQLLYLCVRIVLHPLGCFVFA